jgi:Ca2+-binding EF-hand superfamily protein
MNFVQKAALISLALALPIGGAIAGTAKQNKTSHHAAMAEVFSEMDVDQDNTVTQKEIHSFRKAWFNGGDSDKDGKISVAELDEMMKRFRADHLARRLVMMDTDGNGHVDGEEFAHHRGRWMNYIDENQDGAIEKAELMKASKRHGKHRTRHGRHGMH